MKQWAQKRRHEGGDTKVDAGHRRKQQCNRGMKGCYSQAAMDEAYAGVARLRNAS